MTPMSAPPSPRRHRVSRLAERPAHEHEVGSESPRDRYETDALAAILRNVRIDTLAGQGHEGMTTAPQLYAEATMRFLLVEAEAANA
jgi:hypothetical protein